MKVRVNTTYQSKYHVDFSTLETISDVVFYDMCNNFSHKSHKKCFFKKNVFYLDTVLKIDKKYTILIKYLLDSIESSKELKSLKRKVVLEIISK